MNGIAGALFLDGGEVSGELLSRMGGQISHRGRAGLFPWSRGSVGLLQAFNQIDPGFSARITITRLGNNRLVLVADARIDNRDDLLKSLDLNHRPAKEIDDHHLILEAYMRWGEDCPRRLVGDFAFALWDSRSHQLFCARDAIGVRPFYYYQTPALLLFGSEIDAFVGLEDVDLSLNPDRLGDFLTKNFEDTRATAYREVHRLPPAHCMTVGAHGIRIKRYWEPNLNQLASFGSEEEASEAFRELFVKAVSDRLRGDSPVGVALSGGLDSSSILATAVENGLGSGRVFACSAIFPEIAKISPQIDERTFMAAVIAATGVEALRFEADRLGPLRQCLWNGMEPLIAPNLYLDIQLLNLVSSRGGTVMLSGIDGDSAISYGYERLPSLVREWRWRHFLVECRALAAQKGWALGKVFWRMGLKPLVPNGIRSLKHGLLGERALLRKANGTLDLERSSRLGWAKRVRALRSNESIFGMNAAQWHWLCLSSGLFPHVLETLDKVASRRGVELRYPFFDRRLIEFCLALPVRFKLSRGWDRAILRRSMAGWLPERVAWRKHKANLSPNFNFGLLARQKDLVEETMKNRRELLRTFCDPDALQRVYRHSIADPSKHNQAALDLFIAVVLARWLDARGAEAGAFL